MAEYVPRTEAEIGEDAENVVIAQTRASDKAASSILSILCRGVFAPELAHAQASTLARAEGFYVHTASGADLDRRLADFGLQRRPAGAAFAVCRFTRAPGVSGAIAIPAGTTVRARASDGAALDWTTRAVASMTADQNTVDVVVDAVESGARYNVGANTITTLIDAIPGLPPSGVDPALPGVSVDNLDAVTSGRDRDTDEQARQLFFDWLDARTRATPQALRVAALTYSEIGPDGVERFPILSAHVKEHLDAPGAGGVAVTVYIIGHSGLFATAAQHAGVLQRINGYTDVDGTDVDGWRAAGILVETADPTLRLVDVAVQLKLSRRGTAATVVKLRADLTSRIAALPIGQALTIKTIYDAVTGLGAEVDNARILTPEDDVGVAPTQKVKLGSLQIEVV